MLKFLEETGTVILNAWLPKQYPETRLWRALFGLDKKKSWSEEERSRMRLIASKTLTRLKAKGLVAASGAKKYTGWAITAKGKEVFEYSLAITEPLPEDGKLRIMVFDIPELHKADRDWIRGELISAGFVMLQKSVWIGKRPLPEHLLTALSDRGLFEHFHIFEIKESGTLRNLDWKRIM
jgi:DNA-binding transcriptional regulator PaaX